MSVDGGRPEVSGTGLNLTRLTHMRRRTPPKYTSFDRRQRLPLLLSGTIPDPPHRGQDGLFRRFCDQLLDSLSHQILAELVGEGRLGPRAQPREPEAVLERFRVAELAALLDQIRLAVLVDLLVAEGVIIGRRDAETALDRSIRDRRVARLGLVHAGGEGRLRLERRRRGLRARGRDD